MSITRGVLSSSVLGSVLSLFVASCSSQLGSLATSMVAASYYVDSTAGSDSNSGTSSSSPWKTLSKVAHSSFAPGATVYLKRGGVWYEDLVIPSSGLAIDAYGSGSLPQINGSRALTGAWTSEGGGIYSQVVALSSGEALGNIAENGTLMSFLAWDANAATTFSGAANGSFSFNFSLNKIYIKTATSPASNAYTISVKPYGIDAESKSDITINHVDVTRFSLHGIQLKNCVRCSVKNSAITFGGGAVVAANSSAPPAYLYAGNGIEFGNASSSGVVDSVTVSDIFDSGISPQTYSSNQTLSNIILQNTTIDKAGFAGVEVSVLSNGGATGSVVSGMTMRGLTVTNSGKGWSGRRYGTEGIGIRIKADLGAGTMSGISLQTSTIEGSAGDGVQIAGEVGAVTLSRLRISSNSGYGINVTDPTSSTLKLLLSASLIYSNLGYGLYFNAPAAAGFGLFQNTFYNNATINFAVLNQAGEAKLQNNLFYSSAPMTHLYVASSLTGATINNNCYNNVANMVGYNGSTYSTVSSFNGATGFESNGIGGAVVLTNPSSGDFTLQSSSQCRGLGASSLGVSLDYSGYAFASPPSSGAYEYR